jgi:hypothetical protein
MPTETLIVVSAVLGAFALFLLVLAWAEARTRNIPRSK